MASIHVKTEIPGPRSRELMAARQAALPSSISHATPVFVKRAQGAVIEDVDGNHFLDFAGGIGVLNVGHCFPAGVDAVRKQAALFTHTCMQVTPFESYVRLAEQLNRLTPGKFPKKTFFVNSGAEAVENAVKFARYATKRPAVICFEDAFHGRTLGALTLTSKIVPYKDGFGPFLPEVYRIPYAYCYRCSYQLEYPACQLHCAHQLEDIFKRVVSADSVAAVIAEPVLGEGGFVVPPQDYFRTLHDICKKHGILFIADEVQSGFGRTGKLFACEWFGVEPDILVAAKSIAGGLPLASVTGRAEIMDKPIPGGMGSTFGGNPLACAAALEVIKELERGALLQRSIEIGQAFQKRAEKWKAALPLVGDVRGLGGMCAIELVAERGSRKPAKEATGAVSKYCYEHGLITISAGTFGNIIRVLVPLVASDAELQEGLDVVEAALHAVNAQLAQRAVASG
jgi:4-aminobutyrate aminotransferase / (S)-3-amino-2-methylpropionate transaminase / 5-aminovalerate transaminase